jgi:anti-sigma-K factor RskA
MDIQSFIDSGILEKYVLGDCSVAETIQVEQMVAQHAEVRAECERIELQIEQMTQSLAIPTPQGLQAKIMDQISRESQIGSHAPPPARLLPSASGSLSKYLYLAAAIAGLAGSSYLWKQNTDKIAQIDAQKLEIAACNERNMRAERLQEQIAFMDQANTKRFDIASLAATRVARGAAVYRGDGKCLVSVAAMDNTPKGKSYQLWAIINGVPVSMGVLNTDTDKQDLRELPCAPGAVAYAISLEPEGGSAVPTEVIMMSKS